MIRQFSRYVAVQLAAYAVDMGVFLLLTRPFAIAPVPANVVAKLAAGALAFVLHRRITFRTRGQGDALGELGRYALLLAANVPIASGILWLLLPLVSPAPLAKFAADVAGVLLTFALSRSLVFRRAPGASPP